MFEISACRMLCLEYAACTASKYRPVSMPTPGWPMCKMAALVTNVDWFGFPFKKSPLVQALVQYTAFQTETIQNENIRKQTERMCGRCVRHSPSSENLMRWSTRKEISETPACADSSEKKMCAVVPWAAGADSFGASKIIIVSCEMGKEMHKVLMFFCSISVCAYSRASYSLDKSGFITHKVKMITHQQLTHSFSIQATMQFDLTKICGNSLGTMGIAIYLADC
ncbi:hypothetical protein CEXT_701821 [Caerostris extrusa]|uniref:Uncharacterized protein n=1 Tax=Caerostris extrusa TaxID=172846 RepID=A0AAV4VLA1_CAEEX|nr:hypothetical protein CEXT_701821 [Caerostris extrusa]